MTCVNSESMVFGGGGEFCSSSTGGHVSSDHKGSAVQYDGGGSVYMCIYEHIKF